MKVLNKNKPVIGMIHLPALPGTPKHKDSIDISKFALKEAKTYIDYGIDILMIENMHDVPYLNKNVGPEIIAIMTKIAFEIKRSYNIPLGIQILAGANKEAIAAAKASGADFIRAEGFVFAHIADEGTFNSDAGELLRYRKAISAQNVKVFTDIKKKHSSHSITSDTDISETAKAAEFFLSDGVIITGSATGEKPSVDEIRKVKTQIEIPVIAGSGITIENIEEYYNDCDSFIIGSHFKFDGFWENDIDPVRVKNFMKKIATLRK